MRTYETIVGLETHVELATAKKLFCACDNAFGGRPNSRCCPVCSGLAAAAPPALNPQAVTLAVRAGLGLGCHINLESRFDRKHYASIDLPKGYQITQFFAPLCTNGTVIVENRAISIRQIHLEEDSASLSYRGEDILVDLNRSGVPLIELVTGPDFRTGAEVGAYLNLLRERLIYLGVSDCKMQEGSLRVDVNISVRPVGATALGVRTELKNLGSIRAACRAIEVEGARQIALLEAGEAVIQETRRWDEGTSDSLPMRRKETAQDYGYCPDPDVPPLQLSQAYISQLAATQLELAEDKRARYIRAWGLSPTEAITLTGQRETARLFEETVALGAPPREVANWVSEQVLRRQKEEPSDAIPLAPEALAEIIQLLLAGTLTRAAAQFVLLGVYQGGDVADYVRAHNLIQQADSAALERAISDVLEAHPHVVAQYRSGNERVFTFLMGQIMKRLGAQANPTLVAQRLREKMLPL